MERPQFAGVVLVAIVVLAAVAGQAATTNIHVVNSGGSVPLCVKYWVPQQHVGGGCRELRPGQAWDIRASETWEGATMWALRGGCGGEACHTGPPNGVTQFQFTLNGFEGRDYYDLSIAAGFNMALAIKPTNAACTALSCLNVLHGSACQAGATKTCTHGSTDYNVNFSIA